MRKINVTGMSCGHCVASVTSALEELGLTSVKVELESGTAEFTPTTAFSREQITEAIEDRGFEVSGFED